MPEEITQAPRYPWYGCFGRHSGSIPKQFPAFVLYALGWMPPSTQVLAVGLLLTAAVVFAQTASQWIDFHFFDLRLRALDSGHHLSVFGAASILAQAVAAAAIALRAASMRR